MNSELVTKALKKVTNPNILVNLVSRRVRQLSAGGGSGRPLLVEHAGLGAADVALLEIIEGKLYFEVLENEDENGPASKRNRKT